MFTFVILSSIAFTDRTVSIKPGDLIYQGGEAERFSTEAAAIRAGEGVLDVLDDGPSYDKALSSVEIIAIHLGVGGGTVPMKTAPASRLKARHLVLRILRKIMRCRLANYLGRKAKVASDGFEKMAVCSDPLLTRDWTRPSSGGRSP